MNNSRVLSPGPRFTGERNVLGLTVGSRRSHTLPTFPSGLRVVDTLLGRLCIRDSKACISLDAKQTCGRQGWEGCVSRDQRSNLIRQYDCRTFCMKMVAHMARASLRDVGMQNLEKRLGPLFEYLHMRNERDAESEDDSDVICVVVSCGQEALEAARGGLHDAKALVCDAFFCAWVSHAPSIGVTPGDPFAARSLWRLSLKQFEAAVQELNLQRELRDTLRRVPKGAARKIIALLDDSFFSSDGGASVSNNDGDSSSRAETETDGRILLRSEDAVPSSHEVAHDVDILLESVRQATRDNLFTCAKLAGTSLLCSQRYRVSREKHLSEASDTNSAERELIAVLNRIRGDADAASKRDAWALAVELVQLLLTSPETTFTHLARVASTNTSQASLLLSAFSAQPGIIRMQMDPHEPTGMMMEIARLLHKPPAELKGFHALEGIQTLIETLCQPQESFSDAKDSDERFGKRRLALPSRSQLDHRHVLLFIVFPALSLTVDETDSEFEFWALRILQTLLTGFDGDATGDAEASIACSPSGTRLLRATYPGSILLALASRMDSRSGSVVERTRELAARLLRCCVTALNSGNLDGEEDVSTLESLAHADAEAATRLSWHTRILMETLMHRVRQTRPNPTRSPPAAPSPGPKGDVGATASALADMILLCATQFLRGDDMMDLIHGKRSAEGNLKEIIEYFRDCSRSSLKLRGALLEACTTLLPRLTAREFDVVQQEALPRLLGFVQGVPEGDKEFREPLMVDFLTRVSLTLMDALGKNRDIETVSRQLSSAATTDNDASAMDGEHHTDVDFLATTFHSLTCVSMVLSQMTTHSSEKAKDILLNVAMELAGKLCDNESMVSEVAQLFEACPDERCKHHILAVCNTKGRAGTSTIEVDSIDAFQDA